MAPRRFTTSSNTGLSISGAAAPGRTGVDSAESLPAWPIILLILTGAALRWRGFFVNALTPDEALFAGWARLIAVWRDPLLHTQAVDKPPLLFYAQALFFPLFGPQAWAARVPNLVASLLLIPLIARLYRALYGSACGAPAAAAVVALAPLTLRGAGSAFIDPLLTTLLVAALTAQLVARPRRRALWGGALFGLAALTKYQAWLFLPLVVGLGARAGWRRAEWSRWLLGVLPALVVLALWGGVGLQWQSYGGIRPIHAWELLPRLRAWAAVADGALPWPVWVVGALLWLAPLTGRGGDVDRLLALFGTGYLALHGLLAVPPWERYLLPLLPVAGLAAGRVTALIGARLGRRQTALRRLAPLLAALVLLPPALVTARGASGTARGAPATVGGAAAVAAALADAPTGAVLYDHWFSWQMRYHLFDSGVYVSWFPHADALLADLAVFADDNRWLVLPDDPAAQPVLRALADGGYRPIPHLTTRTTPGMVLYRIGR